MIEENHRGQKIEVRSYLSEGGKWRPDVKVEVYDAGTVTVKSLVAPASLLLETEQESDRAGVTLARRWIDDHG
jgi:hypothetical protein